MIYDCFMFFENLELLELRLMTLNPVVDRFVLVEMGMTHMNKPKPLHFENNKHLFEKYLSKIIHVKRDAIPWTDERQCEVDNRNLMAEGYAEAGPEDYIIISDEDEIPNPDGILEGNRKRSPVLCYATEIILLLRELSRSPGMGRMYGL